MKSILFITILFSSFVTFSQEITGSFQPTPGKKYLVSGWVREVHTEQQKNYLSYISIYYEDADNHPVGTPTVFLTSGDIIEGWQRIVGILEIPEGYENNSIVVQLNCADKLGEKCFYDDIRFLPYNGNLKSFVYDEETNKLLAELDENNYATFYEYDQEGGLIRIKKETEKGVFTIQESRSSNPK